MKPFLFLRWLLKPQVLALAVAVVVAGALLAGGGNGAWADPGPDGQGEPAQASTLDADGNIVEGPGESGMSPGTDEAVPPSPEQLVALGALSSRTSGELQSDFNPLNGTPRALLAHGSVLSEPSADAPGDIASNFLLDEAELFAVSPEFVSGLVESRVFENDNSGVTHVWYEQQHQGLDVFQSNLRIAVTADGEVLTVTGSYYPGLSLPSIDPALSQEQGMNAAFEEVGPPVDLPPLGANEDPMLASARDLYAPSAELVAFPLPNKNAALAWRVEVPQAIDFWEVVVDANTGAVLHVDNRTLDHAEGQVFLEHPDAGPLVTVPFTGPLPAPRDAWMGASVFSGCTTCSNGNNVTAIEDRDSDFAGLLATDPAGHLNFGFANSYALTGNPDADQNTSITNLYYLNNVSHDHFYQLGFTEAAGNFQSDNFGAGGLAGDPVFATTYTGWDICTFLPGFNCRNNAWFVTTADGDPPLMQTFLFTSPPLARRDSSLDGDIVIHEYGHGVSTRLVGLGGLGGIQSGAMGEGWSDYFAISFYNDPVMGEYGTGNPTTGIRRYAYNASPLTYGDLCTGAYGCEVHDDGEIWGAALWDLRDFYISQLGLPAGAAAADEVVVEGLMLTPLSPSMLDSRDAILAAELAMGGAYQNDIWQVFANRGMGCSATSVGDSATVSEAFDLPPCAGPGIPNDDFADAIVIPGSPYTNAQSTVGATTEPGEPQPCAAIGSTVWYRYTPGASGSVTVDTEGSGYDTALAVYTGASLPALVNVGCDDDGGTGLLSTLTFPAVAGATYQIQVGGYAASSGNLVLNLTGGGGPCPAFPNVLNCFPKPGGVRGLAFQGGSLWGNDFGTLYEMNPDTGAVLSSCAVSPATPSTYGLGFDTLRNLFLLTDALNDVIWRVDLGCNVVSSFSTPTAGPVGVAYDPDNDSYWISDWEVDQVQRIDAGTFATELICDVTGLGASRIAGAGYSPAGTVLFNSRDDANTYMINGGDCSPVPGFPIPTPPGVFVNNGQGAAVRPSDCTGYVSHSEDPNIWVLDIGLPPDCGPGVSTRLWGYEGALVDARMLEYDVGSGVFISSCVPLAGSTNGLGVAHDPIDGNLWYTFVIGPKAPPVAADGLIHKASPTPACASLPSIPFGDGSGGSVQDDVGALDIDPDDGHIWAAGYEPIGGLSFLYKVDRVTGAILRSCHVPFGGGGTGNDTLAVAEIPGLPGSGKYLLTDAGEPNTPANGNTLLVVDAATCVAGGPGTVVAQPPKVVGMTGIDFEGGKLIAADLTDIYDLGAYPFGTIDSVMSASPSDAVEDISLETAPVQSGIVVRMGSGAVAPDGFITLDLDALDVPLGSIGSFTIEVEYDPALLDATACTPDPTGILDFGSCNPDFGPGLARCTGVSIAGVSGPVLTLCDITFHQTPPAVGPFPIVTPLPVNCVVLTDPVGSPLGCIPEAGEVIIDLGLVGDVTCDDLVNVVDALFILQHEVGMRDPNIGCPLPPDTLNVALCDVNDDALCNVVDALFILQCEVGQPPGSDMPFCLAAQPVRQGGNQ